MKKKMSFFQQLFDANYGFTCRNSVGMHNAPLQGKDPSKRG